MTTLTVDTHTDEVNQVFDLGWIWTPDMSHYKNKEMGFYTANLRDDAYGWYTHPDNPRQSELQGDSRPRWMAAQTVLRIWA